MTDESSEHFANCETASASPRPTPPHDEGLVDVAENDTRLSRRRLLPAVVVFLVGTAGVGLFDVVRPVTPPEPIGLEKIREDRRRAEARFFDGSRFRLIDRDLKARSGVRDAVRSPYAMALYRGVDESKGVTVVGRDGRLFMRDRLEPRNESSERLVGTAVSMLSTIDRVAAAYGMETAFAPVPRRAVVLEAYRPRWAQVRPALDEHIVGAAHERGLRIVDLLEPLRSTDDDTFFALDSHWTDDGARLAMEAVAKDTGWWKSPEQRATRIDVHDNPMTLLDIARFAGLDIDSDDALARTFAHRRLTLIDRDSGREVVEFDRNRVRRKQHPTLPDIALVGTSYTAGRLTTRLLEHFIGEPVLNASTPGSGALRPLIEFVHGRRNKAMPSRLVHEFPLFMMLERDAFRRLGEFVSRFDAPKTTKLASRDAFQIDPAFVFSGTGKNARANKVTLTGDHRLATLSPTRVVHDGAGIVRIRLRGNLSLPIEVIVKTVAFEARSIWRHKLRHHVLPIVTDGTPMSATIILRAASDLTGAVEFELTDVAVVGDLAPKESVKGRRVRRETDTETRYTFASPVIAPRSALVLEMRETSDDEANRPAPRDADADDVHVELHFGDDSTETSTTTIRADSAATIVVDLRRHASRRLREVVVRHRRGTTSTKSVRLRPHRSFR